MRLIRRQTVRVTWLHHCVALRNVGKPRITSLSPAPTIGCFGILSLGGAPMGVDYGWEKFFSSIHYAVTSTERLQQRLQGVVSGIDGLRRDSFPNDETYERFEKLVTAVQIVCSSAWTTQRGAVCNKKENLGWYVWMILWPKLWNQKLTRCHHGQNFKLISGAMLRRTYGRLRAPRWSGSGKNRNRSQSLPLCVNQRAPRQPTDVAIVTLSDELSLNRSSLDSNHTEPNPRAQTLGVFFARRLRLFPRFEWLG
jgi:hypothetical protein